MAALNSFAQGVWEWLNTATLTQPYGCTGVPNEPRRGDCPHFHSGTDWAWGPNANIDVMSVAGWSRVERTGPYGGYGNAVITVDATGNTVIYGHLRQINVRPGDGVWLGRILGKVGGGPNDPGHGNSTGRHLHIEVRDPKGNTKVITGTDKAGALEGLSKIMGWTRPYDGQYLNANQQVSYQVEPTGQSSGQSGASSCVKPDPLDLNPLDWIGYGLCQVGEQLGGIVPGLGSTGATFLPDVVESVGIFVIGGIVFTIGLLKLGEEGPVSVVVQPAREAVGAIRDTAGRVAAVAAK